MNDCAAAEEYVNARCDRAQPGWREADNPKPVDWGDGDLIDAFRAGIAFATQRLRAIPMGQSN